MTYFFNDIHDTAGFLCGTYSRRLRREMCACFFFLHWCISVTDQVNINEQDDKSIAGYRNFRYDGFEQLGASDVVTLHKGNARPQILF